MGMPANVAPSEDGARLFPDAGKNLRITLLSILTLWTVAILAVSLAAHGTALYLVETDLLGEYIPAALELSRGHLSATHYSFKGPGYPALLALATWLSGADSFTAARILSVLSAGAA